MQTTVYLKAFVIKNNVRMEPEKVNTRSFSPTMVRSSEAASLFQGAEFAKGFAYRRIFRFAMKEGRDRQLKIKPKVVDSNGQTG